MYVAAGGEADELLTSGAASRAADAAATRAAEGRLMQTCSTPRRDLLLGIGDCHAAVHDQRLAGDQEAASDSRKAAALAVSAGSPSRFIG